MRFQKLCFILFATIVFISSAAAIDIKINYDTSYYEKYNPDTKDLSNTPYAQSENFFIQSGRLSGDGIFYTLGNASEMMFSQKALKTYDLQTVVIQIDGTYYKAKPSFKKLFFTASGKKNGFGYSASKELILVYVPYSHKIQVLGVITQGQFIQENEYTEYNIDAKKEAKKQVLHKTLEMLGCRKIENCNVKSDKEGNNYFYEDDRLIGFMENFGNEKLLIRKNGNNKKHIATIKMYGNKILMKDRKGNLLYRSDGSKKIRVELKALDYEIGLKIST